MARKVKIWTDGSCLGNPGPGGWGAILVYGKHEKELSGGESQTTNNRMELMAAIQALEAAFKAEADNLRNQLDAQREEEEGRWAEERAQLLSRAGKVTRAAHPKSDHEITKKRNVQHRGDNPSALFQR